MLLHLDVEMTYRLGPSRVAMLSIEAAEAPGQSVRRSDLAVDDSTLTRIAGEGGVGTRLWAHVRADVLRVRYTAEIETDRQSRSLDGLSGVPMHALPAEALTYLRPSRLCQSDEFAGFVARRFGKVDGGRKVSAIQDWVQSEITYLEGSSQTETTVLDTFARREGVCRDFAHLVCALARAAGIPARYAAVYGVGVAPPDFHAVAEVWLEGAWHLVDATGMCRPDGMAVIGVGRDACDAPFMETIDEAQMITQSVSILAVDRGPCA